MSLPGRRRTGHSIQGKGIRQASSRSAALAWGSAGALLARADAPAASAALVPFVLAGMAAGSIAALPAHPPAFLAFIWSALLPYALRLAAAPDRTSRGMAAITLLYALGLSAVGWQVHRTLRRAAELHLQNASLVGRLEDARQGLEATVAGPPAPRRLPVPRAAVYRSVRRTERWEANPMHTLYWAPDTGAFAVQAVLEELGLPYRREVLSTARGDHLTPAFLALNPMGQVPVLRLPDGTVVTETAAMLAHLCDARSEAGLLPAPGTAARAVAYRWLFWLATGLYETDLRYYYPERYTEAPEGADGVKAAALARMDRLLAQAEGMIGTGPYCLGERFSAVDIYASMLVGWHPDAPAVRDRHPRLGEMTRLVRRRPAVERVWSQHHPTQNAP